jgi:predicted transcriptional regulator
LGSGKSRAWLVQRKRMGCHMVDQIVTGASLARQLRDLRKRFGGKQWWLAHAIGCTEAAVSLWENGKRTPHVRTLGRIANALAEAGAPPGDVARLCESWRQAKLKAALELEIVERFQ